MKCNVEIKKIQRSKPIFFSLILAGKLEIKTLVSFINSLCALLIGNSFLVWHCLKVTIII